VYPCRAIRRDSDTDSSEDSADTGFPETELGRRLGVVVRS